VSDAAARIVDANLNRCREALRVIEEYARFVRDDRFAASRIKAARHTLTAIIDAVGGDRLLAARAADTDVGRDLPSPSQARKTEPRAVAAAAFKRLQEALRSIEEYGASIDARVAALAGPLRFDAYQLERTMMLDADPPARFARARVYLLIGSDLCPVNDIPTRAAELLDAGVDALQLREKHLDDGARVKLAERLCDLCRQRDKLFIVNDRPDIARLVAAHGVHVGQGDLPVRAVRQIAGDAMVGLSTHTLDQVRDAITTQATYIAVGPAFATATKPHEPTAGLEFIRQALNQLKRADRPGVVIGGITLANLSEVRQAGASCIALASAILHAAHPAQTAAEFARRMAEPNLI
jgi:thiamine-phosphate pyrophosphorylase